MTTPQRTTADTTSQDGATLRPSFTDEQLALRRRKHARRHARIRWVKRGALILLGLGVVGAIAYAWVPKPVEVEIATARRSSLEVVVEEEGRTRLRDRYLVSAPAGGDLDRIALEEGDRVEAGTPIARVRPPEPAPIDRRTRADLQARLSAARARERAAATAVEKAEAARALAAREAERARALGGAITVAERDRAELQARVATAELAAAREGRAAAAAEVRSLRASLGTGEDEPAELVEVTSPVAGRVVRILRESEGPVLAGTPLVEIGDPRAIEIVVDVLSSDAVRIAPGADASLEQWGGPALAGRVTRVEPSAFTRISALGVEEQRVHVVIDVADPPAELGDGYRVVARIRVWRGDDVLTVPASAVFRDGEQWALFAVDRGRASLRHVGIGHRGQLDVQVVEGLEEGATVILYPSDRVSDGVKITTE
jgi:HlyD family secretion protein